MLVIPDLRTVKGIRNVSG